MNGMTDESVDFWKKAYTGENQTEVLAWKIKNRQYITGEELKKRNASKQKPAATKSQLEKVRRNKRKVEKSGKMKYIMKKNKMMLLAAACSILLLGSCGTSKNVQGSGSTSASHQKENATQGF